jgi:hypothetical protein
MICAFCGREIPDQPGKTERCGSCLGGCRKIHCPWCGYANPLTPDYLKRLQQPSKKKE